MLRRFTVTGRTLTLTTLPSGKPKWPAQVRASSIALSIAANPNSFLMLANRVEPKLRRLIRSAPFSTTSWMTSSGVSKPEARMSIGMVDLGYDLLAQSPLGLSAYAACLLSGGDIRDVESDHGITARD